jgi:hypothetical protein
MGQLFFSFLYTLFSKRTTKKHGNNQLNQIPRLHIYKCNEISDLLFGLYQALNLDMYGSDKLTHHL